VVAVKKETSFLEQGAENVFSKDMGPLTYEFASNE
jgi:hypothetical protein